jgi:ABC-type uncharacterized transport system substrate-binding protein
VDAVLKEVAPAVTRVALLFNPRTAPGGGWPFVRPFVEAAARSAGVEALPIPAHSLEEIHDGLAELAQTSGSGLVAMPDSFVVVNEQAIIRSMERYRLPAIYPFRLFAEQGGLMSYGVDTTDLNARAATYVDRILKGERTGRSAGCRRRSSTIWCLISRQRPRSASLCHRHCWPALTR